MAATMANGHSVLDNYFVFEVMGVFLGGLVSAYAAGRLRLGVTRGPRATVAKRLMFAVAGGIIMGFAARLGRGCTSGQALIGRLAAVGRQLDFHVRRVRRRIRFGLLHAEAVDMIFPFESLSASNREFGLVVGVLLGFCFGFVLERAGFGRSTKLAAQFYLYDMTVFKVMFSAIVTAMLGVVVADGLGLVDIGLVSRLVVSETFIWPMLVGGLLLGVGFIISGYCPGTSLVAAASGNVDGMFAFFGVIVGSVLFGLMYPLLEQFNVSGAQGQLFIYELLGLSPAVVAVAVVAMAVGCFVGAEIVERMVMRRFFGTSPEAAPESPRRFAFASFSAGAAAGLLLLFVPIGRQVSEANLATKSASRITVQELAKRCLDEPWKLRMIDLRDEQSFLESRIPGSEHATTQGLEQLGLQYSSGVRDLVLVAPSDLPTAPAAALAYPGSVLILEGGFASWRQFALQEPQPPGDGATEDALQAYRFQSAVHAAVTGVAAPPPPAPTRFQAPPKRKAGGCS